MKEQYDSKVYYFRTDHGGECFNEKLARLFAQKGIRRDVTPPYSPESNGVAKRLNRSIGEGIRAMLLPLKDKRLWAETARISIHVKNMHSHSALKNGFAY
ncbi:hypothetical protein K3495_g4222 [Podosphaera aphanis]|nr:hypothetical protein K3495_g4222 [Podosphaera aphanis]